MVRLVTILTALFALTPAIFSVSAIAQENRLVFSGAVTESTCSTSTATEASTAAASYSSVPRMLEHVTCESQPGRPPAVGRIYASVARHLAALEVDPVLNYFDAYVMHGQPDAPHPTLLTQIYD